MTTSTDMLDTLSSIPGLYTWTYDATETLLGSTCPQDMQDLFHKLFSECNYHEYLHEYAKNHSAPYALSINMGLVWYAILEKKDGKLAKIYLLGPAFQYPVSLKQLERTLSQYEELGMNFRSKRQLLKAMGRLPVIPHTQLASYAIMLHYCVTGERITYQDLHLLQDSPANPNFPSDHSQPSLEAFYTGTINELEQKSMEISPLTYQTIWNTETEMLEHLRLGISPEQAPFAHRPVLLPTDTSGIQTPIGKLKTSAVILTSLCARTAVECGLTYEKAYHLADEYLGKIENEPHSPVGLQRLIGQIYEDFYEHIQSHRQKSKTYSHETGLCLDYVQNHVTERIALKDLACLTGYAPYYLSRKFKEETGTTLREYARVQKIKYAATLLVTTKDSVADIAEKVGLSSRSHFTQDFHDIMGMSPAAYRTANKK